MQSLRRDGPGSRVFVAVALTMTLAVWFVALGGFGRAAVSGANASAAEYEYAPPAYTAIALGNLGGGWSYGQDVNARSQVVGQSATSSGEMHAFLWEKGVMRDLGTLGSPYSIAFALNDAGMVVGASNPAGADNSHAFVWNDGVMTDLGTLGGSWSYAQGINNRGEVIGRSETSTHQLHSFLWKDGVMTDLGEIDAWDINERGQVVGLKAEIGYAHAVIWENGTIVDLGVGQAFGISPSGTVAGWRPVPQTGRWEACVWQGDTVVDLGTLGGNSSVAYAINPSGIVVGSSYAADWQSHAAVWKDGEVVDLGMPGTWSVAYGINQRGEIAGSQGANATLWQPAP
jgi:probable HAF family extracellular repeat protein